MLFTFPSRYWFTIGHRHVFSLVRWSSRIPTGFHVSRRTWVPCPGRQMHFVYGAITLYGGPFQVPSTIHLLCNSPRGLRPSPARSHDPALATPASLAPMRFGLFPVRSPLLGESRLFSFPGATKMFQFAPFARSGLCIHPAVHGHYPMWVSPFRNPRISACLAAPRGLSQPSTPFFAGRCQGIHRLPLVSWSQILLRNSPDSTKMLI